VHVHSYWGTFCRNKIDLLILNYLKKHSFSSLVGTWEGFGLCHEWRQWKGRRWTIIGVGKRGKVNTFLIIIIMKGDKKERKKERKKTRWILLRSNLLTLIFLPPFDMRLHIIQVSHPSPLLCPSNRTGNFSTLRNIIYICLLDSTSASSTSVCRVR
jgi:hypothetical protein